MTKLFFRWRVASAALCVAVFSGVALAECGGADPGSEPVGLEVVRVQGQLLDYGGTRLLGLAGERVRAEYETPDFSIEQFRMVLNPAWQERVDWSAYGAADAKIAHTRLYFDRRADGTRRLCRIAEMAPSVGEDDAPPGPLVAQHVKVFEYRADARLVQVAHYSMADEAPRTWTAPQSDCYFYDAAGWPVGKVAHHEGSCAEAKPGDAQERYVHAPDGHLLRAFRWRSDYTDHGVERVDIIDTYADDGVLRHRYVKVPDHAPRLSALPQPVARGDVEWHMDELGVDQTPWRIQVDRPGVPAAKRAPWRFALLKPEFFSRDRYFYPEAEREVVAEGRADAKGMIALTAAQQRRLIDLVQRYPGLIVLRVNAMRHFALWPEVPPKVWDVCHDPARNAPTDCE